MERDARPPHARCGRDIETGAAARLQIAHRDEAVVGLDHRKTADLVSLGEFADRRQFGAGPQMPVVDLPLDAGDDLVDERLVALWADGQGQHAGSRLVELARSPDQYSHAN